MSGDSAPINLTNHFLIAMPGLIDELFAKSVVYVCEHSERGALGLVINKPAALSLSELVEKVSLPLLRTWILTLYFFANSTARVWRTDAPRPDSSRISS